MKKILFILGLFISVIVNGQVYNPSIAGTTSNKPYAPNASAPTDSRSYFYDAVNFVWRPYQNTAEVLTYLNLPKYRTGQFDIVVNFGGVLSGGLITGGVNSIYYFKDGQADSNLVLKVNAAVDTSLFLRKANNLNDLTNAATARNNLGLGSISILTSTASGDLSGTWPNITVTKFNGLLPSYYLNYTNLTNTPTIPTQFNPIAGANIALSGTYPNITFSATTSGGSPCLNCNADSLKKFPFDTAGLRNGYALTIDSTNGKIILSPNGTGTGITQLTGDGAAGPGSGSQAFTLATINSNVGVFGTANQVPQITLNGKGLSTAASNVPIQISEGQVTNLTTDLSAKWGILGNGGTSSSTNFIGTTDNVSLSFRINNQNSGRIDPVTPGNVALGYQSLNALTTGVNNVAIGTHSLAADTSGRFNTAVGEFSMGNNLSGGFNAAYGGEALAQNTSGINNTAVGYQSMDHNTTGSNNTGIGFRTLYFSNTGNNNATLGDSTLINTSSGSSNIAIGHRAGVNNTSGSNNVFIGYLAGQGISTGSNNTIVGSNIGALSNLSNNIILADGAGNVRLQYDNSGNLNATLQSSTSDTTNFKPVVQDASGNIKRSVSWFGSGGGGGGITSLNGLTGATQTFATGTSGTDFNIVSSGTSHTFNFPDVSGTNRGLLTSANFTLFSNKEPGITASNTVKQYWNGYKQFVTLNTDSINEGSTNLFFTNTRARNAISLTTTGTSGVATYTAGTGVFNIPQYQGALTLTTTGTSGAATLIGNTLNIPQYSGGGGGTIGGSIATNQVAYGSSSNTIAGEAGFEYDASTNNLSSDTAIHKKIHSIGAVKYPIQVEPNYSDYAGILIDNQSTSGAAANQIYLASGAGAYKDSGLKIYQLPQGFSGGYNFGVVREIGSGGLILASNNAPMYFETGTPGVDNAYLGAAFNTSKNWIIGPDIGGGDLTDVHGVRLMVNGAFKTRDSVVFCDNGGGFANVYAGNYRDQGYLQDVGFQFYNRNSTSPFIAFRINPNASLFSNYYRTSATASGYTRLAVAFDGSGNMQQKQIFDSTSGTANPDQILYYEGPPTSNANFKYSPTAKTLKVNYGGGGGILTDTAQLYSGKLVLNDAGFKYVTLKAANYQANVNYVEGVGFDFTTVKFGNQALSAFRIDSAGEVKIPIAPAAATTGNAILFRDNSAGGIRKSSVGSGLLISGDSLNATNIYNSDGTLSSSRTLSGNLFRLNIGASGSHISQLNLYSDTIGLNGALLLSGGNPTNANLTVGNEGVLYLLPTISANRTITLPSASSQPGRILTFPNANTADFNWSFASTVINPDGSSVTTLLNGYTYTLQAHGTFGWLVIGISPNINTPIESAAATLTLNTASDYIFNGSTTTWTLPLLANNQSKKYYIKNAGSGNITLQRSGSDNLYETASTTSVTITPGTARIVVGGASFWYIE